MMIKKVAIAATLLTGYCGMALAQKAKPAATVQSIVAAEESFDKLVAKKGIKDAFISVADPEGMVFKPEPVKITDFYSHVDKQPGTLTWTPKFARISANGDLGFSAGPYVYQKDKKNEDDKVFGDYVSIWRLDPASNKLKLLVDLGIQHPEPEQEQLIDFREPDSAKRTGPSKDPFNGKQIITNTDRQFNATLGLSVLASYKEFLSPEGRMYFPGFEPIAGRDKVMKFIANEGISMSDETLNSGRSSSGDLGYSYGKARVRKGDIVSNYNYVRIWEVDASHKWNILLEVFSAVEN
ncbi:hypothetical protein GCM10027037_22310 [Mucilaginibacter koreensis]